MDEKELELLLGKVSAESKAAIKTELADAVKGLLKADELGAKLEAIGLTKQAIDDLTAAVEKQGLTLNDLKAGQPTKVKSLKEILAEKKTDIAGIAEGTTRQVKFDIPKKTLVGTAAVGSNTIAMRLPDIGQMPYAGSILRTLFSKGTIEAGMNKTIRYIDQTTVTRNAAGRSETTGTGTGTFAESAIAWTEYSFAVPEIADSIPVSKESFKFISFIQSEINRLLENNIKLKEDDYFWDGTGTPPISKGVYTYATAFVPATYAATSGSWLPGKANMFDLALILQEQISNGFQSKYAPNLIVMNPGDYNRLIGTKNEDGDYIKHPLLSADGKSLAGMTIVTTSQASKNTMLVCDAKYATIYDAENLTIEMGYVGNQFIEGALTLRAYESTGILVRNSDLGAFMKVTDISDALAAVNATSN